MHRWVQGYVLIGSEDADVLYEGDLWTVMVIYTADSGLGRKWNGIISTISMLYTWQESSALSIKLQDITENKQGLAGGGIYGS